MKKIKFITYAIFIFIFGSCKTKHPDYSNIGYNNVGYKNFYIVDTITIETPISFTTKEGHWVITEDSIFSKLKTFDDKILTKDGIFLFEPIIDNLPLDIPINIIDALPEIKTNFSYSLVKKNPTYIHARKYRGSMVLLLMLVSENYFNHAFVSIDGTPLIEGEKDNIYYKLAVPILSNDDKNGEK